jgi:hypothetical protein
MGKFFVAFFCIHCKYFYFNKCVKQRGLNLLKPRVLYIGRAYRYPPDVAFYIYFFNKYYV